MRKNYELPPALTDRLQEESRDLQLTETMLVREALDLLFLFMDERRQGYTKTTLTNPDTGDSHEYGFVHLSLKYDPPKLNRT